MEIKVTKKGGYVVPDKVNYGPIYAFDKEDCLENPFWEIYEVKRRYKFNLDNLSKEKTNE